MSGAYLFPGVDLCNFIDKDKAEIETDIQKIFQMALKA